MARLPLPLAVLRIAGNSSSFAIHHRLQKFLNKMEKDDIPKSASGVDPAGLPEQMNGSGKDQGKEAVTLPTADGTETYTADVHGAELKSTKQFGFLDRFVAIVTWTPRRCRYDPGQPPKFGWGLNFMFALVCRSCYPA